MADGNKNQTRSDKDAEKRLKLLALDEEDLNVISAHCQDAVLKQSELIYLPKEKRFVVTMNRFSWVNASSSRKTSKEQNERRKSVLHFERIERVASKGLDLDKKDQVLSLLAITFTADKKPAGVIELIFSGKASLRLEVECIEAQLSDMQASWAARAKPDHG